MDLLVHLVLSHHGHGRPLVLGVEDSSPVRVSASVSGTLAQVSGDLSEVDWGQPARFRRLCERYGVWGLALMEAMVRQADHAVSSVAEVG
jgi:CRISPR-associated endonuclease/helicase Cas3